MPSLSPRQITKRKGDMIMPIKGNNRYLCAPSLAHTVGNVTFKFTKMLREMFGKKFFKYVYVDTRMAYTEMGINNKKEFIHKNKPILAIKPVIDITNDDIFLSKSLLTTNMYTLSFQGNTNFNFNPFYRDLKVMNAINYLLNRIRVVFGVVMEFDTVIEQMNVFNTLNMYYVMEQPYYYRTAIEIQIPHSIMQMISVDVGIPIYDENGSVEKFLKYINMNTCKPVTFQMKNSTGIEEFFLYYPLNIEYVFTDFSMDSVEKRGFASNTAAITFTLTTEFNTIGMFEYTPPKGKIIDADTYNFDISVTDFKNNELLVPVYSYENMFSEKNENGWKYFTSRMYKVEDDTVPDTFDLSQIFISTNIKDIIAYHNQNGISNDIFFDMKVYMIDAELKKGVDYSFNFNTLTLTTNKVNTKVTYRFIIYINNEYVNDLMRKLNPDEFSYN